MRLAGTEHSLDWAVQSITRISETTTFAGLHLIDGSLGLHHERVEHYGYPVAGYLAGEFRNQPDMPVSVNVLTSRLRPGAARVRHQSAYHQVRDA